MTTITPYLIFNGNCEEAFHFYEKVFGGRIIFIGRYKDVPQESRQIFSNSTDEQVMHATLKINTVTTLMGSDSVETYEKSKGVILNNFFLYINNPDQADTYRIFDELAVGGKIIMPMAPTFWSTHFGMVADKFGINWKITFEAEQERN